MLFSCLFLSRLKTIDTRSRELRVPFVLSGVWRKGKKEVEKRRLPSKPLVVFERSLVEVTDDPPWSGHKSFMPASEKPRGNVGLFLATGLILLRRTVR